MMNRQLELREHIANLIEHHSRQSNGSHPTSIPSLFLFRQNKMTVPTHGVHDRSICFVFQGQKEVMLAQELYRYESAEYIAASVDLPVISQVVEASPEAPYLALKLKFTPEQILEVIQESKIPTHSQEHAKRGLFVGKMEEPLMDAVKRLMQLLDHPEEIPLLAPLITKEILFRIMQGKYGMALEQIVKDGGGAYRIIDAIEHIKQNFEKPLRIDDLAEIANMSVPSLYRHFKDVTAMSPIQFQKHLRLQAARSLLLTEPTEAAEAAFRVGYESPSQFSREYTRMFGLSPIQDIKRLRALNA
ncbi:AraC family transcriptional regulator [Paenibacillus sp. CGMCC 1.16610]|uniref:Helix-turn-helix domain-containing protein n=1 Tax=Paenibacillus anseongense TaxID=2682845 RepID=A0ABW9U8S9_9BACL|nr:MULTISPECIES: AraC family transcriptional regulator [Paenibacillus]MBA2937479.1 AraC family transcriptional regulator [Paenibacillus sp. CGMCC 1.16610]MVQ36537.1 helix-turn-helix domain-containing protein [Paenibacillus anseongense]